LLASVALGEWHEFFNRPVAPPKWTRGHRASLQLPVSVTIGLQQQNLDWLDVRAPPRGFCYFCVERWLYFARMMYLKFLLVDRKRSGPCQIPSRPCTV
jgi:hypothetical protein